MKISGGLVALCIAGIVALFAAVTLISANNYAVRAEKQIGATWNNNKNILSTYTTKITEMAQVPDMQTDNLTKVMQAAFEGRYGENGSQAIFQAFRESYPGQVDNKLYQTLMTTMDAGRTEFRNNQERLIDQKREYETQLDTFPNGMWMKMLGFPKADLDKYNVVLSTSATKSFETGIDDGVKLR